MYPALFCPDLASVHYNNSTKKFLRANNVDLKASIHQIVRSSALLLNNIEEFKNVWGASARKVNAAGVQNLMKDNRGE